MSINDIILRIDQSFFWISLPEADIQVIKKELCCDIWLKFAPVTVQICAVYMEMYRHSAIVLLHSAKLQAACLYCLYKFSLIHSPIKTKPQPH